MSVAGEHAYAEVSGPLYQANATQSSQACMLHIGIPPSGSGCSLTGTRYQSHVLFSCLYSTTWTHIIAQLVQLFRPATNIRTREKRSKCTLAVLAANHVRPVMGLVLLKPFIQAECDNRICHSTMLTRCKYRRKNFISSWRWNIRPWIRFLRLTSAERLFHLE